MSTYASDGQYELNYLSIIKNDELEKEFDIMAAMKDMTIYESIYTNTISGNVTIVDSTNFIKEYSIGNRETIKISYNTAGVDTPTSYVGTVYKVSKPFRMSDHASGYTLYFMSEESFISNRRKQFSGHKEEISNIVQKLYDGTTRLKDPKPLRLTKTRNIEHYVFTGDTTFEAINMIGSQAVSDANDNGYVFYEDMDKFNFVPIEELYQQDPTVEYYYKNAGNFDDVSKKHEETFNAFQDIEIMDGNSYTQSVLDGEYGSAWGKFSIYEKNLHVYNYDVGSKFDETKSLGKSPYIGNHDKNAVYSDKLYIGYASNESTYFEPYVNGRMVKLRASNYVVSAGVFGDSTTRVGIVCKANIPTWCANLGGKNVSGKYLVAEIKHIFTQKLYTQRFKLIKDAFEETL
jgi:hypothetical protein